jgi:hypothetical protein
MYSPLAVMSMVMRVFLIESSIHVGPTKFSTKFSNTAVSCIEFTHVICFFLVWTNTSIFIQI